MEVEAQSIDAIRELSLSLADKYRRITELEEQLYRLNRVWCEAREKVDVQAHKICCLQKENHNLRVQIRRLSKTTTPKE